jgi:hypothetical protein
MKLTVIPSDRFISVDGEKLFFDFTADPNIHAIQWHENHGHVEYINPRHNEDIAEDFILPFVTAFNVEKARLESVSAAELALYNSPAKIAERAAQAEQAEIDALVNQKMRDNAIAELKKEGKLDANGKIPK